MKVSRKFLAVLVAVFVIVLAGGTSVPAITHGQPDGNAHPYVGLEFPATGNCTP